MACEVGNLGPRHACVRRCQTRASQDAEMLVCLTSATRHRPRRCDLVRRCVEVRAADSERPEASVPLGGRFDATGLGPEIETSLEARLLRTGPDGSRYALVLLLRGRAQWDGGLGTRDAGEPLDAGLFDAGLAAPDVWIRVGEYDAEGRLPLVRIEPALATTDDGTLFEFAAEHETSRDRFVVRKSRDEIVVEHAFEEGGLETGRTMRGRLSVSLRVRITRGATVRARRQIVD